MKNLQIIIIICTFAAVNKNLYSYKMTRLMNAWWWRNSRL